MSVTLFHETLQYVKDHPEEWSQNYYFRGGKRCFIGTAFHLAGLTEGESEGDERIKSSIYAESDDLIADLLGLTTYQVNRIAFGTDDWNSFPETIEELEALLNDVLVSA